MANPENEFRTSLSTRSFFRTVVGIVILFIGLCAIYDIEPLVDTSLPISEGFKQTLKIGPYTGDIGVNFIGSLFVMAGIIMIYKLFNVSIFSLYANPEYLSLHQDGVTICQINKEDIDTIYKSGMVGYGTMVIIKTGENEFVFRDFDKLLMRKAWNYLIENDYPVRKT